LEFEGEAEEGSGKKKRGERSRHYIWLCFSFWETENRVRNCVYKEKARRGKQTLPLALLLLTGNGK
jgi:hypothetical protein